MLFPPTRKTIAVDFDGTLCRDEYPAIGEPNTRLIEVLKQARQDGHEVILWTLRDTDSRDGDTLTPAVAWCARHGLVFDAVNQNLERRIREYRCDPRKIAADIYLDDRAMHPNALFILTHTLGLTVEQIPQHHLTGFGRVQIEEAPHA